MQVGTEAVEVPVVGGAFGELRLVVGPAVFAVGSQDGGGVVDAVIASFGVAEAEHDAEFTGQVSEALDVGTVGRLGDLPQVGAKLRLVDGLHDHVALEKALGGDDKLRALRGGPADVVLQLVGVGGFVPFLGLDGKRRRAD